MRYAQLKPGQKLHLVEEFSGNRVSPRALCGIGGEWCLTINLPMGHACMNCQRVYKARHGGKHQPIIPIGIHIG